MRHRQFLTGLAIAAGIATSIVAVPSSAAASALTESPHNVSSSAAVAAQLDCGFFNCSWVFSKRATNDIATGGAASAACAAVPTPGNIACGIGFAALIVTANKAKNRGKCAKITWTKVPPPPVGTWWPSVDGGSRCR